MNAGICLWNPCFQPLGYKSQCLSVLVKISTYVSLPPGLLGRHPSNESFLCQAQGLPLPGSLQSSPQPTQLLWGQHLTSHLTDTGSHEAVTPLLQVGNLGTQWGLRSLLREAAREVHCRAISRAISRTLGWEKPEQAQGHHSAHK